MTHQNRRMEQEVTDLLDQVFMPRCAWFICSFHNLGRFLGNFGSHSRYSTV